MPDIRKYSAFFKKNKYLFLLLFIGIAFLLIPGENDGAKEREKFEQIKFSIEDCEKKIEKVLSACEGVGRVSVALSVSGGTETIYAVEESVNTRQQENDSSKDSDKKVSVLSVGSGVEEPIIVRQMFPKFIGATVVCDGANIAGVRNDITQSVSSLTGITTDKITIIKMKN